jgi:hypothetical protein
MATNPLKLEIHPRSSRLFTSSTSFLEFSEGPTSKNAKDRLSKLKKTLEEGWLSNLIEECGENPVVEHSVNEDVFVLIRKIVDSVTSEVGRAVVGLCVLQLTIKAICPDQSIRLHKGGASNISFSWVEGMPMRVLDKSFNTPALRKYGLLKMNADGVFMTRTLAENYPYSIYYKAAVKGAKEEWLTLVEGLENGSIDAEIGLKVLIGMLLNQSEEFEDLADQLEDKLEVLIGKYKTLDEVRIFISHVINSAPHSARLFEIAMHSYFQVLDVHGTFGNGQLKPLTQMRSANKKHGNIGDIEVLSNSKSGSAILQAWDAKYGKPDLTLEFEELKDKLRNQNHLNRVGFVVNLDHRKVGSDFPDLIFKDGELEKSVEVVGFDEWIEDYSKHSGLDSGLIASEWIQAFVECLCQKRRAMAPIDEPTIAWVKHLLDLI